MQEFIERTLSGIGLNDLLDIVITTYVIYKLLCFIKETRAQQLLKGLIIIVLAYFAADFLELHTMGWILRGAFTIGIFALIVLFQPELRRGLEVMGRTHITGYGREKLDKEKAKHVVDEISEAVDELAKTKTGALIVFERETNLEEIAETGTFIKADISEQLICNLFYLGSPLHDGAVIIRGDQILAAGCVLPLTENQNINKSLGTRHRAGIGITENSDCMTIIVSEETGVISIAKEGKLERFYDKKAVQKILLNMYIAGDEPEKPIDKLMGKLGRKKDAEEQ